MLVANGDVGTSGCWGLVLEPGDAAGMAVVAVELGEIGVQKMTVATAF